MVSDGRRRRRQGGHGNSLNPCSNGIWSLTLHLADMWRRPIGLNPCSNGIWSLTQKMVPDCPPRAVLILVLMEYGL